MNIMLDVPDRPVLAWPLLGAWPNEIARPEEVSGLARPTESQGGLILVIDDELSIRAMVAELLDFEGYQVVTASNGAEGVTLVQLLRPSLVLLDMRMPVLDGWGFARAMEEIAPDLPIVVMTAAQDARAWAREIGAAGYVSKPFDIHDLLDTIARFL